MRSLPVSCVTFALSLFGIILTTGSVANAQTTFARSIAVGDSATDSWNTVGEWSFPEGASVTGIPTAFDEVYVGDRTQPVGGIGSPAGLVEVSLSGNGFANNLFLGSSTNPDFGQVTIFGTGQLQVADSTTLTAGSIIVSGAFSSQDLSMESGTSVDQLAGTVEISNSLLLGGDFNLVGGTLVSNELIISGAGELIRTGGSFDFEDLSINNMASLEILGGDVVRESVTLSSGASLLFSQNSTLGLNSGLTLETLDIDEFSTFEVNFDAATPLNTFEGDWVLALMGDQEAKLQSFIDNGQIFTTQFNNSTVAAPLQLGVFFDEDSDTTFVTAVPEPGTLGILLMMAGISGLRRSRKTAIRSQVSH